MSSAGARARAVVAGVPAPVDADGKAVGPGAADGAPATARLHADTTISRPSTAGSIHRHRLCPMSRTLARGPVRSWPFGNIRGQLSTGDRAVVAWRAPDRNARPREHRDIGHRQHHGRRRAGGPGRRRGRLPGHPVRRSTRGGTPLPRAGAGTAVVRGAGRRRARPDGTDAGIPATLRRAAAEPHDPRRRVPEPECVDARPGRAGPAGTGVDPRRCLRQRLERRSPDGRFRLRPGRGRHGRAELPARRRGVRAAARRTAQPRPARPGCGVGVGARQRGRVRRRPGRGDRRRRVRRRDEHRCAARDAARRGPVPARESSRAGRPTTP